MTALPPKVLFGAAYYHEYHPTDRLKTDMDLMAKAGFSVIRVGESVWSTWEPSDGVLDLEWLAPVIDAAAERGIAVILGTPTYAVPPWLARRYPEIAGERRTGERIPWGARQEVDYTHPAFRWHAERVIRAVLARYTPHPAVIGVQVDNEPGLQLFHNRGVFERFVDELRDHYGDVQRLNEAWGLTYWSHRLSTWADLWTPDGNTFPQYDLAWRRFQARLTTEFISWQADIAREYLRDDQWVTTCIAYSRPAVEDDALAGRLDVTAGNLYYAMQDGLSLEGGSSRPAAAQGWASSGVASLYFGADRVFSSRQEPFLVTETDAASIGGSWMNYPPYRGQLRQAAWALVARGARMVEYWHWHTLPYGAETYWGGVLPHSLLPGRIYEEVAQLGEELGRAGSSLADLTPDADVGIVYSLPSKWAMEAQPPLARPDGTGEAHSYERIVQSLYEGAFDRGRQVRLLHPSQLAATDPTELAARLPVLVAAGLYVAGDETLDWLETYAAAGGHLILGVRTGYGGPDATVRIEAQPARLRDAAGVVYDEFSNVAGEVTVLAAPGSPLEPAAGAAGGAWIDSLRPVEAEPLAVYDHPHFGEWPAVTTNVHGRGRVTYLGTVPNRALSGSVIGWATAGAPDLWPDRPATVTVSSATGKDGRRVWWVHNWSWDEVTVPATLDLRDVLGADQVAAGESVTVGPWGVRVFEQQS